MDTLRDKELLENLWNQNEAPWKNGSRKYLLVRISSINTSKKHTFYYRGSQ